MPTITRTLIKTGIVYLLIGTLLSTLWLIQFARPLHPLFTHLQPTALHLIVIGWLTQLIFGVALWMFPPWSKAQPRGPDKASWVCYALLNGGLLLRLIAEPLNSFRPTAALGWLLATSAILQVGAVWLFVGLVWTRVRPKSSGRLHRSQDYPAQDCRPEGGQMPEHSSRSGGARWRMPRLSCWLIKAALLHLVVGGVLGGLILSAKGSPATLSWAWLLLPAHIQLMVGGWLLQLALGMAYWILPRLDGAGERGRPGWAWTSFGALNGGVIGVATILTARPFVSAVWLNGLLILAALLQVLALGAFIWHAWPRLQPLTIPDEVLQQQRTLQRQRQA